MEQVDAMAWLEQSLLQERLTIQSLLEQRHKVILERFVLPRQAWDKPAPPTLPGMVPEVREVDGGGGSPQGASPQLIEDKPAMKGAPPDTQNSANSTTICVEQPKEADMQGTASQQLAWGIKKRIVQAMPFTMDEEYPDKSPEGFWETARWFVTCDSFEIFFGVFILLNTIVIGLQSEYDGIKRGNALGYPKYESNVEQDIPWAKDAFNLLEVVFGVIFVIELVLKIVGLRCEFVKDLWNWIDVILVSSWCCEILNVAALPMNFLLLRSLRLLRLIRLVRLVRSLGTFDSLFLMTTAMKGSLTVLFWAVTLLFIAQTIIGLILQLLCEPFITDATAAAADSDQREKAHVVFKYYGTFTRATLTMFEITVGNWIVPCRVLMDNINEAFMFFSLFHKLVIGFSMVSVITGVFIQETFKVAAQDDKIMMRHKERATKTHRVKMDSLFKATDANGDGTLDIDEFEMVLKNPALRTWLAAQDLQVGDARHLFTMLCTETQRLSLDELIVGIGKVKGQARSVDIAFLRKELSHQAKSMKRLHDLLGTDYTPVMEG